MDRFLKMISGFDKEDCEINIRHGTWVFVWREKTYNFEDFFVEKKMIFNFFSSKCVFYPETSRKWKKKFDQKNFPWNFEKYLEIFCSKKVDTINEFS